VGELERQAETADREETVFRLHQGSSDIEAICAARHRHSADRRTATQVCCESSAADAMMLNFKVIMVPDASRPIRTGAEHLAAGLLFHFGDLQTADEAIASLNRPRAGRRRKRPFPSLPHPDQRFALSECSSKRAIQYPCRSPECPCPFENSLEYWIPLARGMTTPK